MKLALIGLLSLGMFMTACSDGNSDGYSNNNDPLSLSNEKPAQPGAYMGKYTIEARVRGARKLLAYCNSNDAILVIGEYFNLAIAPLKCIDGIRGGKADATAFGGLGRYLGAPIKDGKIDFDMDGVPEGTVTEDGVTLSGLKDEGGLSEVRVIRQNDNEFTFTEVNTMASAGQVFTFTGKFSRPQE